MSFEDLIGNQAAIGQLQRILARGQLPSSLLFSGIEGIGKREAAINLAKAVNCLRPPSKPTAANDACDACSNCLRIDDGQFPDVRIIGPEGAGGQIKAEAVREVVSASPFRPFEGRKRVYIFESADRMNPTAANTLLKTLEESPAWIILILITAHESGLLPTLLSRCRKIRFSPLLPEEIAARLVKNHDFGEDDAALAASVSGGSLSAALSTKTEELVELRDEAAQIATLVVDAPGRARTLSVAEGLAKRSNLNGLIRLLLGLLRDLTCLAGGRDRSLLHFDRRDDLRILASRAPLAAWLDAYLLTESCLQDLEVRYANKRITLERLLLGLTGASKARGAGPGQGIRVRRRASVS